MSLNPETFCLLIKSPNLLESSHIFDLENIIQEYPYFQSAKAIHLKSLFNQNSPRYNHWLKQTAAYTTDRSVLFDFIISNEFKALPIKGIAIQENNIEIQNTENQNDINFTKNHQNIKEITEPLDLDKETLISTEPDQPSLETKLSIGVPLQFDENEVHSFEEWLKITKVKPIIRDVAKTQKPPEDIEVINPEQISSFQEKASIIEKFINENPKIKPKKEINNSLNIKTTPQDTNSLMTETLAKIYLEQKKYQKAIQAYEILILKYPEKSYLFANRIEDIKILQQNNS
jgi:tetratricopeptide (TPR) repeat protein